MNVVCRSRTAFPRGARPIGARLRRTRPCATCTASPSPTRRSLTRTSTCHSQLSSIIHCTPTAKPEDTSARRSCTFIATTSPPFVLRTSTPRARRPLSLRRLNSTSLADPPAWLVSAPVSAHRRSAAYLQYAPSRPPRVHPPRFFLPPPPSRRPPNPPPTCGEP
ncbi:hypothetical protein HYPSUDRAFT_568991 [Hypholoma sublateritium FD-334 SS-4]|uniref:Uncharacterized protein n=1 Tax=Hypholoma sublateritium (strain FD-334 SS-4) TaxID=945553 RepID=A0A0D2PVZ8_HYPSF|nr:hypothetical protein HYPSUDRAFT_568991 [Hypholoma sublateritium FD-334 SS-4]